MKQLNTFGWYHNIVICLHDSIIQPGTRSPQADLSLGFSKVNLVIEGVISRDLWKKSELVLRF